MPQQPPKYGQLGGATGARKLPAAAYGLIPPPNKNGLPSPAVHQPVGGGKQGLAPFSIIDRFPFIVGQGLSLQYVANVYRTCTTGYRQLFVDLLDELLEKEPHGYSVLWKRILGVAGARMTIEAPELDADDPEAAKAEEIRKFVDKRIRLIPRLRQHLATLAWATYYAVTASEIHWCRGDKGEWFVERLSFVHSRRLSYPDQMNWDLYVWDQGQVLGFGYGAPTPTSAEVWGLRIADYSDKFIVHAPQLRGDYPTREGIGRQLGEWFVLKRLGARMGAQYLERWAKPLMDIEWSSSDTAEPRAADADDILEAKAAAGALGAGSLSSYAHPDTIKVKPQMVDTGTKGIRFDEWIALCNGEISKPVLGNTLTTDGGQKGGNRALGDVHATEELKILKFDAQAMCDTLDEQLVAVLVRLNFGRESMHLAPHIRLHVEEPDQKALIDIANIAARAGIRVDGDKVAEEAGLPVTPNETKKPRPMMPLDTVNPILIYEELAAAQSAKDDKDAERTAKAAPPTPSQAPGDPSAIEPEPGAPDAAQTPGEGDGKHSRGAPDPDEAAKAKDFASRHAAFLADLKDCRDLGIEVNHAALATKHGLVLSEFANG